MRVENLIETSHWKLLVSELGRGTSQPI